MAADQRTAVEEHTAAPFSERLRAATWHRHTDAEEHGFTRALLAGRLSREGYAAMVAQHYFAYAALEEVAEALAEDPVAGPVVTRDLYRLPALRLDLAALYGPHWAQAVRPSRPTTTYVARIRQTLDWPAGYVAHHYTRYLGDLSGGQFIRRVAARSYGLGADAGAAFYDFGALGSLPAFKAAYRERLDALPLDEGERERVIDETRLAYQLNVEVLADLGRRHPADLAA
ncbi:biliverdin-producing heme oxygenase [Marinitenerispora sediminis]|uniref:biliverdin-producing heme oxygenase n=1 Tax=Marinitenerispora sediminis TaxID=1931232 RepID=UPI001F442C0F|nr:biliverdin-producing heme oxygenase [Marinitenerispora sediminis]